MTRAEGNTKHDRKQERYCDWCRRSIPCTIITASTSEHQEKQTGALTLDGDIISVGVNSTFILKGT
jgi:hypothetical protein